MKYLQNLKNKFMNQIIEKPWGKEEILEVNDKYVVKRLTMNAGCQCSLQFHRKKQETIYVIKGPLYIYIANEVYNGTDVFNEGEYFTIEPTVVHRMIAKETDAIYLECSTPELDDVVRLQDNYNRV